MQIASYTGLRLRLTPGRVVGQALSAPVIKRFGPCSGHFSIADMGKPWLMLMERTVAAADAAANLQVVARQKVWLSLARLERRPWAVAERLSRCGSRQLIMSVLVVAASHLVAWRAEASVGRANCSATADRAPHRRMRPCMSTDHNNRIGEIERVGICRLSRTRRQRRRTAHQGRPVLVSAIRASLRGRYWRSVSLVRMKVTDSSSRTSAGHCPGRSR